MSNWPRLTVEGGPHGKDLKIEIDGEPLPRVTRVELTFDVNDVVRAKIFQNVVGKVDLTITPDDATQQLWHAEILTQTVEEVPVPGGDPFFKPIYESVAVGEGPTLKSAMQAAVDAIEAT